MIFFPSLSAFFYNTLSDPGLRAINRINDPMPAGRKVKASLYGSVKGGDVTEEMIEEAKRRRRAKRT